MSFNLFSTPTIDDIKVGYIDPTLGYVDDVTICEANNYAKNNPGTTFIFRDGDNNVRYLNINEVNRLTPNDLTSNDDECGGIQNYSECKPPTIKIFGGGGVGAVANPVIGRDGSLLAVDLVSGGHGYQYPPFAQVVDDCQIGNGAVLTAVLGETVDEIEVYEGEEDFEEYQICNDDDITYGFKYGLNGEEIGAWEPSVYTRVNADPIRREVEIFQKLLKNPFWTTRDKQPDRITTLEKEYPTQTAYNVTFPAWGDFMNQYAISPVKPSDTRGTDESGKLFTIEWEINFPITGEYIFKGSCDNISQVYIDDSSVGSLGGFNQAPAVLQKTVQEGNHIIRIDLLNLPVVTQVQTSTTATSSVNLKPKFVQQGSNFYLQVDGDGTGEISFIMDVDDNPFYAGLAAKEVHIPSDGGKVKLKRTNDVSKQFQDVFSAIPEKEIVKGSGTFTGGRKYGPIQIIGAGVGARGISSIKGTSNKLELRDAAGDDANIKVLIDKVSSKNEPTSTQTNTQTSAKKNEEVTFSINEAGSDGSSIEIIGLFTADKDGKITKNVEVGKVYEVVANPSNRKLKSDGKILRLEDSTDNDFNDLVIRSTKGNFYDIKGNRCKFVIDIGVGEVVSPKSWNENPMGVSLLIEAPQPPIPKEQIPPPIGECPPNPIWTTRFPGSSQQWYPVNFPSILISEEITQPIASQTSTQAPVRRKNEEVTFSINEAGSDGSSIEIIGLFTADKDDQISKNVEVGKVYQVVAKPSNRKLKSDGKILRLEDSTDNDFNDLVIRSTKGKFYDVKGNRCKFVIEITPSSTATGTTGSPNINVRTSPGWSKFMNRYAISPVLPLETPGSDSSGVTFSNSWDIDLPYSGFYGVRGTGDNSGRILIDGREVYFLNGFSTENPRLTKIFLTKGKHTITTEITNQPINTSSVIDQKIFSTQDWRTESSAATSSLKAKFIKQGSNFYLQVDGDGTGEISFIMDVDDNPFYAGLAAKEVHIPSDGGKVMFRRGGQATTIAFAEGSRQGQRGETGFAINNYQEKETIKEKGKFTAGKKYGPIQIIGASLGTKEPIINSPNRLGIRDSAGDDENIKITISEVKGFSSITNTSQSSTKNGVSYSGPSLTGYRNKEWSGFMNDFSVSPIPVNQVGIETLLWRNVNFPQDGTYKFNFQADNVAKLKVGGREIFTTSDFKGGKIQYTFNATAGNYDISIELENVKNPRNDLDNPRGVALYISKDITFEENNKASWKENPIGVSAILIPPPCSKKIGGKGVVEKIIPIEPGNGYPDIPSNTPGYNVQLILDEVITVDPGINYNCGEDIIKITPDNGAKLSYSCDSYGRITEVKVEVPGDPFTVLPVITIVPPPTGEPTGVNAKFVPVFRVVRDPIAPEVTPETLIQVTDLVGLKQTGYVDGRPYYGAVYYDNGLPYAGYYRTAGTQIRVYATLQESITSQVTTPASAIQRSGTDITNNDPRLNIPGTPQSTTEQ